MSFIIVGSVILLTFSCAQGQRVYPRNLNYKPNYHPGCTLDVFGNSLTDDGVDIDDRHGFKLYSNGPVWATHLARLLGCSKLYNYAYSGAFTDNDNYYFKDWSGLQWQINQYVTHQVPKLTYVNTIVAVEAGGLNELIKAGEDKKDEAAFEKLEQEIIDKNAEALRQLLKSGIYQIIFLDIFEPEMNAPFVKQDWFKDSAQVFNKTLVSINKKFEALMRQLWDQFPGIRIVDVRSAGMWNEIIDAHPNNMAGFDFQSGEKVKWMDWEKFVWFDEYHPTTSVHKLWALKAYKSWKLDYLASYPYNDIVIPQ